MKFSQALENPCKNIFDPENLSILDTRIPMILLFGLFELSFNTFLHYLGFPTCDLLCKELHIGSYKVADGKDIQFHLDRE